MERYLRQPLRSGGRCLFILPEPHLETEIGRYLSEHYRRVAGAPGVIVFRLT